MIPQIFTVWQRGDKTGRRWNNSAAACLVTQRALLHLVPDPTLAHKPGDERNDAEIGYPGICAHSVAPLSTGFLQSLPY